MGKKAPKAEAIRLSTLLNVTLGEDRFPIDVAMLAKEISKNNPDPIEKVVGTDLPGFEGMLRPHSKRPAWHIVYNDDPTYEGRNRFTMAHELGHYQLHRPVLTERNFKSGVLKNGALFQCKPMHMNEWKKADEQREEEADTFASFLLMPIDDYRAQVYGHEMSIELLSHVTDRYGVSLTAAARKWIDFTETRAAMVVSRDGFALWGRASTSAYKSGVFVRSGMALPDLVKSEIEGASKGFLSEQPVERQRGVWSFSRGSEPLQELTLRSEFLDVSISILQFQRAYDSSAHAEPDDWDTVDQFNKNSR
ncbi:MAG: ImmA/IrrE family metallo-endopeptidase [Pseudomonadota bacterium]